MGVQNTTTSTAEPNTAEELSERISEAEEKLTEKAASREADEMYLGEPCECEITDVNPDPEEENTMVEFTIDLPNYKTATLSFSERDFERGRVEEFLENINCTTGDMLEAAHHKVYVTYTDWKGWIVLFGPQEKHLNSTYSVGGSKWYKIDTDMGAPHPNRRLSSVYALTLVAGAIGYFEWGLISAFLGFVAWLAVWYLNCMVTGMSMPHRKPLSVDE